RSPPQGPARPAARTPQRQRVATREDVERRLDDVPRGPQAHPVALAPWECLPVPNPCRPASRSPQRTTLSSTAPSPAAPAALLEIVWAVRPHGETVVGPEDRERWLAATAADFPSLAAGRLSPASRRRS